ncbi:MAG: radical SAM protein [Elusimicrobiales bacterium]|nr:radical SAM protein [Elusimicrobiales bacterium]
MNYSENIGEAYSLPDNTYLRKEKHNVCLYLVSPETNMMGNYNILSPYQAILLAMFDGEQTLSAVCALAAEAFGSKMTPEQIFETHVKFLFEKEFLVKAAGCKKKNRYSPVDFIIPAELTDLRKNRPERPLVVVWHLTEKCFCYCDYCYAERPSFRAEELLTDQRMLQLADEIVAADVRVVTLAGGDPLQNPLVFDIVAKLKSNNIAVYLSTKTLLDAAAADKLRDAGIGLMQVSLDSLNPETCLKLHKHHGHGLKMLDSIKLLKERGLRVNTNTVVTGVNVHEVRALVDKLLELKVDRIGLAQYSKSLYQHKDYLFLSPEQKESLLALVKEYKGKGHPVHCSEAGDFSSLSLEAKKKKFAKRTLCSGLFNGGVIFPNGKMTICEQLPVSSPFFWGDLRKQSLLEAWSSPDFARIKLPPKENFKGRPCFDCKDFEDCHTKYGRCVRNAVQAYGDMWAPDPSCPESKAGSRVA